MIEILRRLILLTCLLAAIASALAPEPALLAVRPVDFAADQKLLPRFLTADQALEEFIARRTEDRLIRVDGSEWAAFFRAVTDAAAGLPATPEWSARLGPEFGYSRDVYFRPDESPLHAVTGDLNDGNPFVYLLLYPLANTGDYRSRDQAQYLGVNYRLPRDASQYAPTWMVYPNRRFSLWLLLAGVVIYVLLPRRKHPAGAAVYSRVHAVIMPDVLGCLLSAVFFALPLFVVPANSSSPGGLFSFEDGWAILTVICWLLALLGAAILAWSAWYAGYRIVILADRLQVTTVLGEQEYRYASMTAVKPAPTYKPSKWLKLGGFFFILVAPGAAGPLSALMNPQQNGILVECRDGRQLRIRSATLSGFNSVLKALQQASVPGDYAKLARG